MIFKATVTAGVLTVPVTLVTSFFMLGIEDVVLGVLKIRVRPMPGFDCLQEHTPEYGRHQKFAGLWPGHWLQSRAAVQCSSAA